MAIAPPPVRLTLRRRGEAPVTLGLRYVCTVGRCLIRVERDGMRVASPAAERGLEDDLSAEALMEAELIWTARDGRERSLISFAALHEELLAELDADEWHPLHLQPDGVAWAATLPDADEYEPTDGAIQLGGSLLEEAPLLTEEQERPPAPLPTGLLADLSKTSAETSELTARLTRQATTVAEWLGDHEHPQAPEAWAILEELYGLRLAALESQERLRRLKANLEAG